MLKDSKIDNIALCICLSVLLLFMTPYIFNTDESLFLIHDNLDSNLIWFSTLANGNFFFAKNSVSVPYMFNGIPRGCYPSEINLIVFLYYLFKPLMAYCIGQVLVHLVAFIGTIIFLRNYILSSYPKHLNKYTEQYYEFYAMPFYHFGHLTELVFPECHCFFGHF